MAGSSAQARLGMVAAQAKATRHPVAYHACRRRLGSRRPARPGDDGLSGLSFAFSPAAPKRLADPASARTNLRRPDRTIPQPGGWPWRIQWTPQGQRGRLEWRWQTRPRHRRPGRTGLVREHRYAREAGHATSREPAEDENARAQSYA